MSTSINGKWYRNSWKEFDFLRDINPKLYLSNYYDTSVNKYKIKCGMSLRFWENKGWICGQDPYGWFQWYCRYYLGRRSEDDERQITRWNNIVNRFQGVIVKIIKSRNAKYNDYSPMIMLSIMIFHLKLDNFYYTGVMN